MKKITIFASLMAMLLFNSASYAVDSTSAEDKPVKQLKAFLKEYKVTHG